LKAPQKCPFCLHKAVRQIGLNVSIQTHQLHAMILQHHSYYLLEHSDIPVMIPFH